MEEIYRLAGEEMDLKELARSFRKGPTRLEKGDQYYFLVLASEGPSENSELLDEEVKAIAHG